MFQFASLRDPIFVTKTERHGKVVGHLSVYGEQLQQHIQKEDEILYPWMDRKLSTNQVGTMYSRLFEVEDQFGEAP